MKNITSKTVPSIDVHTHFVPTAYHKVLKDTDRLFEDSYPIPSWSVEQHLEDMDELNISASILSLSSPNVYPSCKADSGFAITRTVNEEAAKAAHDYPTKFGFFASVPMPDMDATMKEIEYSFDVLKADGIKFYSNTDGMYLGDPAMDIVFAELDRRNALFTVHPTLPEVIPSDCLKGFPVPAMEFQFDTTRAIANMIINGVFQRYTNIRFLCPHMGAIIPLLAKRLETTAKIMEMGQFVENFKAPDVTGTLSKFYYDTAGGLDLASQIPALRTISTPDKWVYGSDRPFTPVPFCADMANNLRNTQLLTEEQKTAVLRNNAVKLFPRFQ